MATGSGTLTDTNGVDSFTWAEVFDEPQPVNVADHTEIDLSDFEADTDGSTVVRELDVRIEAIVPDEGGVTDTKTATATITVTNADATIAVGGEGTFEITSNETVNGTVNGTGT